jgi:hypothetical protein
MSIDSVLPKRIPAVSPTPQPRLIPIPLDGMAVLKAR